ncbi:hypothetical protein G4V62_10460 [Bacillaceae bacterium SIJ1]|uniref:hypothetical protein n=1 Tax=Litoribacterium kuwaitense TaxID=1398745 RepID=UPI0013ECDEAE|nr:hypothetical protein [Litoribacterium kuwaitense]NGP45354.1 hypothetical protein [Litoribacterium kuwaitense]
MQHTSIAFIKNSKENQMLDVSLLNTIFKLQLANNVRSKATFSFVFLAIHPSSKIYEQVELNAITEQDIAKQFSGFLVEQMRESDLVFDFPEENQWLVLLTNSGEKEASFFLKRIVQQLDTLGINEDSDPLYGLATGVAEIASHQYELDEILTGGESALKNSMMLEPCQTEYIQTFKERDAQDVKVSIIEEDAMISSILRNLLERCVIQGANLMIRSFQDGYEYLQSDWYRSSHEHLVIMNDILPKKMELKFYMS